MRNAGVRVGTVYKRLTVIDKHSGSAGKHQRLVCMCDCGNVKEVLSNNFLAGKHCKCLTPEKTLVGQCFGRMLVLEFVCKNSDKNKQDKRGHLYRCQCIRCFREYKYPTSALRRRGFIGCDCPDDMTKSSKNFVYRNYQRNAKIKNITFDITFDEFVCVAESSCSYCGGPPVNIVNKNDLHGSWVYNGVDRLDNNLGYVADNVTPACKKCNFMKSNYTVDAFLNHIGTIYLHNKEYFTTNTGSFVYFTKI